MKINEINERINELENHIDLLKAIKQDYIEQKRDSVFISALDDGIKYISIRLQEYKSTDWFMVSVQ